MKNFITIIIVLGIFTVFGCDSYLDQVNPNELSSEVVGNSEEDLTLLLMGCYDALQSGRNYGGQYRELDGLTDVCYFQWNNNGRNITEGGASSENPLFLSYWRGQYKIIGRCNELISIINQLDNPSDNINVIKAEALFMRALGYYNLTTLFKDVPLILESQSFDDRFVSKNSQNEIKASILTDLTSAIGVLPVDMDYPRVSKGAAEALKAKVHLFFSEWDEVLDLTESIIDSNKYSLYPDYSTLFQEAAEGSAESIFAVPFESGVGEGERFSGTFPLQPVQGAIRPMSNYVDSFYATDGLPISESPLYDSVLFYNNRDPRFDVSILHKGEIWANGQPYRPGTSATGYSIQKYVRIFREFDFDGFHDFMVIRYADVLLMRAEALVESNDTGSEVYQLVNDVRGRVGMPTIESVEGAGLSQSDLRDIIRHERFVEFGLEGIRWVDLKRWNIVEEVYNSITFHNRLYLGDKTLYWPIPQAEIDNNPNLEQHSWWQ